eukprot:XP_001707445.1 Hypothetical protein GL50803_39142 [Giardia lamblia ATCC 50803]
MRRGRSALLWSDSGRCYNCVVIAQYVGNCCYLQCHEVAYNRCISLNVPLAWRR